MSGDGGGGGGGNDGGSRAGIQGHFSAVSHAFGSLTDHRQPAEEKKEEAEEVTTAAASATAVVVQRSRISEAVGGGGAAGGGDGGDPRTMVSSRSPGLRSSEVGLRGSSNVTGIGNGDTLIDAAAVAQPSSSTWSRSEPSSLRVEATSSSSSVAGNNNGPDSGPYSASPERTSSASSGAGAGNGLAGLVPPISNLAPDDEERYEAFGVIDDADSPQGSGSPAASPIAGANPNRNPLRFLHYSCFLCNRRLMELFSLHFRSR